MNKPTDVVRCEEVELTTAGLRYWGEERAVFHDCEAWVKDDLGPGYVGWRCIDGPVPYFEFAGERRVIVTFPQPSWFDRLFGRDPFHKFQFKLEDLGWKTFDRS
jgi:hypothetical protein